MTAKHSDELILNLTHSKWSLALAFTDYKSQQIPSKTTKATSQGEKRIYWYMYV